MNEEEFEKFVKVATERQLLELIAKFMFELQVKKVKGMDRKEMEKMF